MTNPFKSIVAEKVVQDFLSALEKNNVDADIRTRLKQTILEEGKMSEPALRVALFDSKTDD